MNGNTRRHTSSGVQAEALANRRDEPIEYVGFRVDARAVVLNLSEHYLVNGFALVHQSEDYKTHTDNLDNQGSSNDCGS